MYSLLEYDNVYSMTTYDNIRKIAIGQGDEHTTGCLIDYPISKIIK